MSCNGTDFFFLQNYKKKRNNRGIYIINNNNLLHLYSAFLDTQSALHSMGAISSSTTNIYIYIYIYILIRIFLFFFINTLTCRLLFCIQDKQNVCKGLSPPKKICSSLMSRLLYKLLVSLLMCVILVSFCWPWV